jgi:hypothetical protein
MLQLHQVRGKKLKPFLDAAVASGSWEETETKKLFRVALLGQNVTIGIRKKYLMI